MSNTETRVRQTSILSRKTAIDTNKDIQVHRNKPDSFLRAGVMRDLEEQPWSYYVDDTGGLWPLKCM